MLFDEATVATETTTTPTRRREETRKEREKREWAEIRSATNGYLNENAELLQAFRLRMRALFDAMQSRVPGPYTRRPNISLRLIADGDPAAKLIVLPVLFRGSSEHRLDIDAHEIEFMQEKPVKANGQDGMQYQKRIDFTNEVGRPPRVNYIYKSAVDDARRVIATIRDFMADSRAVLARGCDNCCICGRPLSDELSRSRGIGPECIKSSDIIAVLIEPGTPSFLVQPEADPVVATPVVEPEPEPPVETVETTASGTTVRVIDPMAAYGDFRECLDSMIENFALPKCRWTASQCNSLCSYLDQLGYHPLWDGEIPGWPAEFFVKIREAVQILKDHDILDKDNAA
jgi:hypothetical protein